MANYEKNLFSLFDDFDALIPAHRDTTLEHVYGIVSSGTYAVDADVATKTLQLRSETVKDEQDRIKKTLPFLTVSARYKETAANKNALTPAKDAAGNKLQQHEQTAHSGLLCFDFDHLNTDEYDRLKQVFTADMATRLLFTSPRGAGLKRFVQVAGVTNTNHKSVYYALIVHHWHKYKAVCDKSCVNVNRGTFLPHDADAYYNDETGEYKAKDLLSRYPDAERKAKFICKQFKPGGNPALIPADVLGWVLPAKTAPKTAQQSTNALVVLEKQPVVYSDDDNLKALDYIVNECERLKVSLSDCHENNIKIGWALHAIGADSSYFHRITALNPDYDRAKMEERYMNLEKQFDAERVGFGALVNLAKDAGISLPRTARAGTAKVERGQRVVTQNEVRDAVKQDYAFHYDAGSNTYYYSSAGESNPFNYRAFTRQDTFLNELLSDLEDKEIYINRTKLEESIFNRKCYTEISYLPLCLDYMHSQYDGKDHLSTLLSSIDVDDNALFDKQFTKWAVNVVAQICGHRRQDVNDNAIILTGAQNAGKTSFFDQLLWNNNLFASKANFNFENKNDLVLMTKYVLINLDEMSAYGKNDIRMLKSGFTESKLVLDRKYEQERNYKRVGSFVGCSNNSEFLRDDTGDRRFLVYEITKPVDWKIYESVDKQQLWGQIVALYKAGYDFKFSKSEVSDTISRNLSNFTAHKPEDTFISYCVSLTNNPADFVSYDYLESLLDMYRGMIPSKTYVNTAAIKDKLKLAGATLGVRGYAGKKQVRGIGGVVCTQPFFGMVKQ